MLESLRDILLQNDTISTIVAAVLVLIPAIIIHELGHFLAGKSVGITILEFGLGFPPRLAKLFTHKGTEYTLNWLPLGGFVRPLGEDMVRQLGDDQISEDRAEAESRGIENIKSVGEAKPLERIWFMAAGAIANFLFAIVLFVAVAMIGLPVFIGARVEIVELPTESVLAESGLQVGDFVEEVNGEKFDSSQAFINELYALNGETVSLSVVRPVAVEAAEGEEQFEIQEVELAFTPDFATDEPEVVEYPVIAGVVENSPAEGAGLEAGDLVTAFNGEVVANNGELQQLTQANLGQEVTLTLLRGDETVEVSLVPRENPPQGEGSMGVGLQLVPRQIDQVSGFRFQEGPVQEELQPRSFGEAVGFSVEQSGNVIGTILSVPVQLIRGTISPEAARPVSIVGIGQLSGAFLQESVEQETPTIILNFIAVISIALGLTNLLPLPALDGGRIMFVIVEIIRGKPISPEREGYVHMVGLALLLSLMVVLIINDVLNPVTDMLR